MEVSVKDKSAFASNKVGFYIDSIQFKTYPCWKPWATRENLKVITPTSNVYIEDYTGQLENKYLIDDPSNQANGPSEWVLNISKQYWQPSSIKQKVQFMILHQINIPLLQLRKMYISLTEIMNAFLLAKVNKEQFLLYSNIIILRELLEKKMHHFIHLTW